MMRDTKLRDKIMVILQPVCGEGIALIYAKQIMFLLAQEGVERRYQEAKELEEDVKRLRKAR